MSVSIKSAREIELMRAAGKILAKVHENLGKELRPGMSTRATTSSEVMDVSPPLRITMDTRHPCVFL